MTKILIIDNDINLSNELSEYLIKQNIKTYHYKSASEVMAILEKEKIDIILLEYQLYGTDGIEVYKDINKSYPDIPVIMMTAYGDNNLGIKVMDMGIFDFIQKPFNFNNLLFSINRVLKSSITKTDILKNKYKIMLDKNIFISSSKKISDIINKIDKVAKQKVPVLICGEAGVGKTLLAKIIHKSRGLAFNKFIEINASFFSNELFNSDFFGHKKGAFTNAFENKNGIVKEYDNGTICLEDIDLLTPETQVKLLRFLDSGEYRPIGSAEIHYSNINIISITNKDVDSLINEQILREDLFQRLNVIDIYIPPLRERKEDIYIIANHYLELYNKKYNKNISFHLSVLKALNEYLWPGNVRELQNLINSLVLLNNGSKIILKKDLPEKFIRNKQNFNDNFNFKREKNKLIKNFEKVFINKVLYFTNGNVSKAAEIMKLDRSMLNRKISKYSINNKEIKTMAIQ